VAANSLKRQASHLFRLFHHRSQLDSSARRFITIVARSLLFLSLTLYASSAQCLPRRLPTRPSRVSFYTKTFYPALPLSHDDRPSRSVSPIVANILKNAIPTTRTWRELHKEINSRLNDTRRPHTDTTAQPHLTPRWRLPQASPHDEPTDRPLHYSHLNPNPNIG
jgi:hypothetical protein